MSHSKYIKINSVGLRQLVAAHLRAEGLMIDEFHVEFVRESVGGEPLALILVPEQAQSDDEEDVPRARERVPTAATTAADILGGSGSVMDRSSGLSEGIKKRAR